MWQSPGLPEPWWNAPILGLPKVGCLGDRDCWLDEVAMLWEIESTDGTSTPRPHEYTVRRAALFTAAGVVYPASKPRIML